MGTLGQTSLLGRRVWERQQRFRIVLGPLSREQFDRMLLSGSSFPKLRALVQNYVGEQYRWDIRLILRQEAVKPIALGRSGLLGRTSFLIRSTRPGIWDDVIVDPFEQGRAGRNRGHGSAAQHIAVGSSTAHSNASPTTESDHV